MGKSMTSPPCSVTEGYLWPNWGKHLLANLKWTNRKHSQPVKWMRRVGLRDVCVCVCVCVCVEIPFPCEYSTLRIIFTTYKTLWTQIFMHCWGFKKQASWLKHWCLVIDLNLSVRPSSPRCRNYEPLFSSLSVEYSILSVWYSSSVWLSNCIPEIITWPMKQNTFQEFQEACFMKQEKDQTWKR